MILVGRTPTLAPGASAGVWRTASQTAYSTSELHLNSQPFADEISDDK